MNDEIKEILDLYKENDILYYTLVSDLGYDKLLDLIIDLQEEVENLREEDWAWHQLLKVQNKREYRSKFLKEFQEEFGTNTFPDYDEIYKRYDKLKKENERLKEIEKEHKNCTRKHWQQKCAEHCANEMIYKSRNEKAIDFLDNEYNYKKGNAKFNRTDYVIWQSLKNILNGDDNN